MNIKFHQSFHLKRIILLAIMLCSVLPIIPNNVSASDANLNSEITTNTTDRLRRLEEELRCLVCQNQSLADSNADLANDLRREVAELAKQGKSDQQIVDFLKERYGDFVSYRPPLKTSTLLLWLGPLLFFGVAVGGIIIIQRRRSFTGNDLLLSPEEEAYAQSLLDVDDTQGYQQR